MKLLVGLMLSLFAVSSFARSTVIECESPLAVPGFRAGDLVFVLQFSMRNETVVTLASRSMSNVSGVFSSKTFHTKGTATVNVGLEELVGADVEFTFSQMWLDRPGAYPVVEVNTKILANNEVTTGSVSCRRVK